MIKNNNNYEAGYYNYYKKYKKVKWIPEIWNMGLICPILKKGYKGVVIIEQKTNFGCLIHIMKIYTKKAKLPKIRKESSA